MEENINLFDFSLTDDEMNGLKAPDPGKSRFIPAGNEPSAVLARAFMTIELVLLYLTNELVRLYGECRESQNTNALKRIQLCCASSLIPRQLAAGYLIDHYAPDAAELFVSCGKV